MRMSGKPSEGGVVAPGGWLIVSVALCLPAHAQTATRDLSAYSDPGAAFTVSITVSAPAGTIVVGLEDAPPVGWSVSNISNSGTWDTGTAKVKWGPFFDPSIPALVSYDVSPPADTVGTSCFLGRATFDVSESTIGGDACLEIGIPTLSEWGLMAMAMLLVGAGTLCLRNKRSVLTGSGVS